MAAGAEDEDDGAGGGNIVRARRVERRDCVAWRDASMIYSKRGVVSPVHEV